MRGTGVLVWIWMIACVFPEQIKEAPHGDTEDWIQDSEVSNERKQWRQCNQAKNDCHDRHAFQNHIPSKSCPDTAEVLRPNTTNCGSQTASDGGGVQSVFPAG